MAGWVLVGWRGMVFLFVWFRVDIGRRNFFPGGRGDSPASHAGDLRIHAGGAARP